VFGGATSSYQIAGTRLGGGGPSHWDDFAAEAGRISDGSDGALACDHYHRFAEDLDLVRDGGFGAYRFSFSWPRLLPESDGVVNPEGVAFYDRLLDAMLERGLQPFATLYHWDLPRRHALAGGWQSRDTCGWFADYTDLVMRHFGDRLHAVAPVNEPWCVSWLSHYWGHHAPGLTDLAAAARSMHYIQLAHGKSLEVLRGHGHRNVGCVLNKEFAVPVDGSDLAAEKTALFDGIYNRWFEESTFKGCYPQDVLAIFGDHMPDNYEDDLGLISAPLDWAGSNYYTRSVIQPDAAEPHIGFRCIRGDLPKTDMGWEVDPAGLGFFLRRMAEEYAPGLPQYVTENGMANDDRLGPDGGIDDQDRIAYFEGHLEEISRLVADGVPIKGYFAWSLLDNYEWAFGYSKRFGIIHVDYDSMTRTPKRSYLAWQDGLKAR
ncbi:MAG: GH1 family beta-glucosidase, partial [Pseudomonadota bacterium]|nr:GH1 family beta-glucosidase [Pseudomonadota bacterium]